jgi:hypothetical protein
VTGFPINPPRVAISDGNGYASPEWYRYFAQIQAAVGSSATATWQDGFIMVPGPLAGISANDVEGGGAAIPVGVITITGDYIVAPDDCLVRADATSVPISLIMPLAVACPGRVVRVKKVDATVNTVVIVAQGGEVLDGGPSLTISAAYDCYALLSTGLGWDAI